MTENQKAKALRWVANQIPDFKPKSNEDKMLLAIKRYCTAGADEIARLTTERDDSKIEYALEYKGYHTYIHYSAADKILYGRIEGVKDLVDFESESAVEIENEFHKTVDDYIAFCKEVGKGVGEKERK